MSTAAKDPTETLTPEQAWERRVERARTWARSKLTDEHDAGDRLHLKVLLTHLDTLALLLERRTEERDGLLEAARGLMELREAMHVEGRMVPTEEYERVHDRARDAIAKVEGE